MGERTQFKDRHTSGLGLSCNAKEEILLNKKLRILESMKRQAENSHTLDQRILYNRFTTKLRRSEMAHAKLLGDQDLVKRLSQNHFPCFHTMVSDGSKKAVSIILQKAEASRAVSAPCRIRIHLAPVSPLKNPNPTDLQGKEAETEDQQNSLGIRAKNSAQGEDQKGNTSNERQTVSRYKRPHTTNNQKTDRLCDTKVRWREIFTEFPPLPQPPAPQAIELSTSLSPKEPVNEILVKDLLEPECRNLKSRSHKLRSVSRNLFLGLDDMPLDISSSMNNHRTANNRGLLNNKVKLFIQKTTALKQGQSSLSQDYYSDRLLEKLGRKCPDQDFLYDTEEEQRKWNPIGPESNHRSITIQKLDRNTMKKDSSLEVLIRECYNKILTEENLIKRNWLNNNPY